MRVLISSQLDIFHTPIVQSQDPEAKYSPSGENTTLLTTSSWPVRVLMCSLLDTLHTLIYIKDPEAKNSPFGENATLHIVEEWPVKVFMRSPLDNPHIPIV